MADWLEGNEAVEKLKQIAASGKLELEPPTQIEVA